MEETIKYKYDDVWFLEVALDKIKNEMDRINFIKHKKEMPSPFNNTGITYHNDVFTVRAYNWDNNTLPNFQYKDIKVWWYKHCDRGTYAECGHKLTCEDINQMLLDCCDSFKRDWENANES